MLPSIDGMTYGQEPGSPENQDLWVLRLYVNSQSGKTAEIVEHLKSVCRQHLKSSYSLEIIDLSTHPELGAADRILALPTLVRKIPQPTRKIIGDLTNTDRLLVALNLRPGESACERV